MSAEILPLRLTSAAAIRIVREIADVTGRVGFSPHAKRQMRKRKINRTQIYRCLRRGILVEGPYLDIHNYWRCTFETITAGENIQVVVAFNTREHLVVVTTI